MPVRWVEAQSLSTYENAQLSTRMLQQAGIGKIYLVTHAWHMPRATSAFEAAGMQVVPAPTRFATTGPLEFGDFLPRAKALYYS